MSLIEQVPSTDLSWFVNWISTGRLLLYLFVLVNRPEGLQPGSLMNDPTSLVFASVVNYKVIKFSR
jgi:hypothetical protein